jgi:nitrite reductase/ring-hydroxylating ferredoxin subunit
MLSVEENELLARVGPGTPGGSLLRRYWHPVLKASALEAGGEPLRVRLLGEDFVAFRSPDGELGFIEEACPHRRVSMSLARNEACGLRCLFHGWVVGRDGTVVEAPSEPAERGNFAAKVRTQRYHVREEAGLVWVFIGSGEPAPFPAFPFTALPLDHIDVAQVPGRCNWAQLLEGQIDSAHVSHLHSSVPNPLSAMNNYDPAPRFDVHNTAWGYHIGALRSLPDGRYYTRITEFVMPYFQFIPPAAPPETALYDTIPRFMVCQVPLDDEHTTVWYVMWKTSGPIERGEPGARWEVWNQEYQAVIDEQKFGQDRARMRAGHFSGINNLLTEDMAVAESMGPIADRSREYLGSSDTAVARFRRQYLEAIRDNAEGRLPRGLAADTPFALIEGRGVIHREPDAWREALAPELA